MKTKTETEGSASSKHNDNMKVRSSVKAGFVFRWIDNGAPGVQPNHNESLRVRSNVKAGFVEPRRPL